MPLRCGLVGAGPWAGMFTAGMLARGPETSLTAVWARRFDRADELARRYDAAAVSTLEELFDRCDAVGFAVPPDVQAELAPVAASAGKHLLLEKPVATTLAAANAVADAVDRAGVVTQLVLTYRYTVAVSNFLAELDAVPVYVLTADFVSGSALSGSPFATPWRQQDNALLDLGPHVLDLLEAAAGPAVTVSARAVGGCVAITLEHTGGAVSRALVSITTPDADGPLRCEAVTKAGRITLSDPDNESREQVGRTITTAFAQAVGRGASDPRLDVRRGVELQRLLDAVRSSAQAQQPVTVR